MKLLIADDEQLIRTGLQSLDWSSVGIDELYAAANGIEAKEMLLANPIDIAIFDIRMPGLTGIELTDLIREYSMDTAVILLTGFSEFEYAREALRNGVYEYLLKPFRPRDILTTTADVMKRLERKRYQAKVVRENEETIGAFDTVSQVRNCFPKTSENVADILLDMALRFDQPLSLGDYADKYHFSKNYVSILIKKETNYSYMDILTAIRVMNAAQLLTEDRRVNLAGSLSGFTDQRYFSQVFKKAFGCSPSEFKKQDHEQNSLHFKPILEMLSQKSPE